MAEGKKPAATADPAKKTNDDDHYEALPDIHTPPKSPPKTVIDLATNYAGSIWTKVAGWLSLPPVPSLGTSSAPPPAPPEPPMNIRLPEDTKTKVKWNNANYQTLSSLPSAEMVFPDKTPSNVSKAKSTPAAKKSSPAKPSDVPKPSDGNKPSTSDVNKSSAENTSSQSDSLQYL